MNYGRLSRAGFDVRGSHLVEHPVVKVVNVFDQHLKMTKIGDFFMIGWFTKKKYFF